MKRFASAARFTLFALSLALVPLNALAQDPLKVGPELYKLLFENDRVRVMELNFKPGAKIGMHSHPDHFVYVQSGGTLTLKHPDGKSQDVVAKAGEVIWIPAESHSAKNPGTTEVKALVVELKEVPVKK